MAGMKQLRIQSDGMGSRTIVTTEDGKQLFPVSAVIWLEAKDVNRVDLTFLAVGTDIHADVKEVTMTCPLCSHGHTHDCQGKM